MWPAPTDGFSTDVAEQSVHMLRGTSNEYVTYATNPAESRERFQEALELIVKAWTEPSRSAGRDATSNIEPSRSGRGPSRSRTRRFTCRDRARSQANLQPATGCRLRAGFALSNRALDDAVANPGYYGRDVMNQRGRLLPHSLSERIEPGQLVAGSPDTVFSQAHLLFQAGS